MSPRLHVSASSSDWRKSVGFYSEKIFPALLDWSLGSEEPRKLRHRALASARGAVLEIGFGTGLNLPFYSERVAQLVALEPVRMLPEKVHDRISSAPIAVNLVQGDAEKLPFQSSSFDTVVTTWTLCSIDDIASALREIKRVLKSDATYIFCEHGRSDLKGTAGIQDFLNPVQRVIACGCNINRPMNRLIEQAGFRFSSLDRFVMTGVPRILGEMYVGTAGH
jgi:ubiquinone/menaquinone biosynthesis C-methylase UbiE